MSPQWLSVIIAGIALLIAVLTYRNTRASSVESSVEKAIQNIVEKAVDKHRLDPKAHNGWYVSREKCDDRCKEPHHEAFCGE